MKNEINSVALALKECADKNGVVPALSTFGSNIDISIPISNELAETSIETLNLSVRSHNCLMRASTHTVGKVIDVIMSERGLKAIKNLGSKSQSEIKTIILSEAYERLSDNARVDFWRYVILHNCRDFAA